MLDAGAWAVAEDLVRESVEQIVAPYGVTAEITYQRGVPPVVHDHVATTVLARAVERVLGTDGVVPSLQSLGGEDFGWSLEHVPGAMARRGSRTPGGPTSDLHQRALRTAARSPATAPALRAEEPLGAR